MRIQRVVARAFGPFEDETLELAPGMTVVAGPNEAGKSSWHAATRLALTGLRRGRGRATNAEAAIADRHRPWDVPDRWEVEARLDLDDGRTIDIHQDLAGKVACRAIDVGLGRDVSDEILDGTPDASRWLGLDRDAFAATVSVSQAEILAVADAADELQAQMQRAAATRGTDATAAQAIERLVEFRKEAVGADTVAAKGPLRAARVRVAAAAQQLEVARARHDEHLEHVRRAEDAEQRLADARHALAEVVAARALTDARRLQARAARAAELAGRHPVPPPAPSERDANADAVAAAIVGWDRRPLPVALDGSSSELLAAELAALPETPVGDLRPDQALRDLLRELERAEQAVALLGTEPDGGDPARGADVDVMRSVARRLAAPMPAGADALEEELASARRASARSGSPAPLPIGAGLGLLALGLLVALALSPVAGIALAGIGAGIAAWGWRAGTAARAAATRVRAAEASLAPYREAQARATAERAAAATEARDHGWPDDPAALEALADRTREMLREAGRAADWRARRERATNDVRVAARNLVTALADRGIGDESDPHAAWIAYEAACEGRRMQAESAARGDSIRRELVARRAAEETAATVDRAIAAAAAALRDAASRIGIEPHAAPEQLVPALRQWQAQRAEALGANQAAVEEWHELSRLLDGGSPASVRDDAERASREALRLAAGLEPARVDELSRAPDLDSRLADRRDAVAEADRAAHELRGALEVLRTGLPDVTEAEEAVAAAAAELQRVQALAATIDETLRLLRSAQDRVHRDLAPVLAAAVQRWLPVVSGGAYEEVSVDPADLSIQVREAASGAWRTARLLSAGTREQVYLLLRVAMAQHLVTTGETAPLLLDEVTAQADGERRAGLLRVLHELSRERQVVLFSHDEAVADWAASALVAPRDQLVRLPSRTALRHSRRTTGPNATDAAGERDLSPVTPDEGRVVGLPA
jgi:exonuclease SbcC